MAGQGQLRVAISSINIQLPTESARGWFGIIWLLIASFPAALGGGVLHPAVNSLITRSSEKSEVGGMLGVSTSVYSLANAIAPLFYGTLFQWFGGPVPFVVGGIILAVLWIFALRVVKA